MLKYDYRDQHTYLITPQALQLLQPLNWSEQSQAVVCARFISPHVINSCDKLTVHHDVIPPAELGYFILVYFTLN